MPNGAMTTDDLKLFELGQFRSAKLMEYHTRNDALRVRDYCSCVELIARLPDFLPPSRNPGPNLPERWATAAMRTIKQLYPYVLRYQFCTEPNEDWLTKTEGRWQFVTY